MDTHELCTRLDEELQTDAYADIDPSANGLQVGPATGDVSHVAFAVDAVVETIDGAGHSDADMLVTHHGISWGGIDRVTGTAYRRIASLIENDLQLYSVHLPLDGHRTLGNAAGIADLLDLGNRAPFGKKGGQWIGQQGSLRQPTTINDLRDTLAGSLDLDTDDVRVLDFGPSPVEDIAIVTGSGVDWLDEAIEVGADVLVTGEGKHEAYHVAREAGVHVVLAGHYATETIGVRSLQELVEDWGLETTFLDAPTGL